MFQNNIYEFNKKLIQRHEGWQKAPEGMIDESKTAMNPELFYNKFVKEDKPVVLRKALQKLPAMDLWPQKNYLKNKYIKIFFNASKTSHVSFLSIL